MPFLKPASTYCINLVKTKCSASKSNELVSFEMDITGIGKLKEILSLQMLIKTSSVLSGSIALKTVCHFTISNSFSYEQQTGKRQYFRSSTHFCKWQNILLANKSPLPLYKTGFKRSSFNILTYQMKQNLLSYYYFIHREECHVTDQKCFLAPKAKHKLDPSFMLRLGIYLFS